MMAALHPKKMRTRARAASVAAANYTMPGASLTRAASSTSVGIGGFGSPTSPQTQSAASCGGAPPSYCAYAEAAAVGAVQETSGGTCAGAPSRHELASSHIQHEPETSPGYNTPPRTLAPTAPPAAAEAVEAAEPAEPVPMGSVEQGEALPPAPHAAEPAAAPAGARSRTHPPAQYNL